MSTLRNHHFLSKCYLKRFTKANTANSKLIGVNLSDGSSFSTIPRNVGAQRDFNRLDGLPIEKLEFALSGLEDEIDSALTRVHKRGAIHDPNDWNLILNLMSLFAVRNPRNRNLAREMHESVARRIMDIALSSPEIWESQVQQMKQAGVMDKEDFVSYETMKDFYEKDNYKIIVSSNPLNVSEFKIQDSVLQLLGERNWKLCKTNKETGSFITCDHPVCLVDSDGNFPSAKNIFGYSSKHSIVLFPLSKTLLVMGTFAGTSGSLQLTSAEVAMMNGIICQSAYRQIYVSSKRSKIDCKPYPGKISIDSLCRELAGKR